MTNSQFNVDAYIQCLKENARLVESADRINDKRERALLDVAVFMEFIKLSVND